MQLDITRDEWMVIIDALRHLPIARVDPRFVHLNSILTKIHDAALAQQAEKEKKEQK